MRFVSKGKVDKNFVWGEKIKAEELLLEGCGMRDPEKSRKIGPRFDERRCYLEPCLTETWVSYSWSNPKKNIEMSLT